MSEELQRMIRKIEGDGPVVKHILLLKLKEALENAPQFGDKPIFEVSAPQRQWLADVGALLSRFGFEKQFRFRVSYGTLAQYWKPALNQIMGQVLDAIEELKLELELDGRSEFGSAYAPGEIYRFFADLKSIINTAKKQVMVVDPYFDGTTFDDYLSSAPSTISICILTNRYASDVAGYVRKHRVQYKSTIELRSSKEIHDRLVLVDRDSAWAMGGSIKDAGKKAAFLIPFAPQIAKLKFDLYVDIWNRATQIP